MSEALAGNQDFQAAKEHASSALDMSKKVYGESHPVIAQAYSGLGNVYAAMGEIPKAEDNFNKALTMQLEILGPSHPSTQDTEKRLIKLK